MYWLIITFLYIKFLFTLTLVRCTEVPPDEVAWESLVFTIPNAITEKGRACSMLSSYYCLEGYEGDMGEGDPDNEMELGTPNRQMRIAQLNRVGNDFANQIFPVYLGINFFVNPTGNINCCSRQKDVYIRHGLKLLELTPSEYLTKLTNYNDDPSRKLNYLEVNYNERCNINFITQIGFGPGFFKINGQNRRPEAKLMFPLMSIPSIEFPNFGAEDYLTFHWFKYNIICQDHPYICGWGPNEPRVRMNWNQVRRRNRGMTRPRSRPNLFERNPRSRQELRKLRSIDAPHFSIEQCF
ncbi:uncharacterized protein LOC142350710 [Convolutriloba macropyga]|uniref:uncharacterized protein LOC142350710 n=1 Tax=Convolutriloba macropyga TaxID=536237 RepID=UPI003F528E3B